MTEDMISAFPLNEEESTHRNGTIDMITIKIKKTAVSIIRIIFMSFLLLFQSRTVREFDTNLTVGMFGFQSLEDYYTKASPDNKIDRVRIPVFCLNAADDPFVPFTCELN